MTEAAAILDQTQVTPETPPAAPPVDDKVSSKLEMLIKREQSARQSEERARAKEAELEDKLKRISEFDSVKADPKKALEFLGLDYNQLTQALLNDGQIPPEVQIKKVEEKFQKYIESQEDLEKRKAEEEKEKAASQETKMIADFKSDISSYLKENTARYEFITFESQEELVYDVIDEHYRRTIDPETGVGKVMTIAEAADKVELHLEQKYEKVPKLSKFQTLLGAIPKEVVKDKMAKPEIKREPPKTLTNQLTAVPAKRTSPLTDQERVQRAIAYAKSLRA